MKIGITGGFGFVGKNLVRKLNTNEHELKLLSHVNRTDILLGNNVEICPGSVEDIDSLKAAFEGVDVVYHLVGLIAETRDKTFEKTVFEGTTNVVEAAIDCGVKKIIYLSALGTSVDAVSHYHRSKYLAEQAIINSGLKYVILRPSVIFGEGDGFVTMLTKLIKQLPFTPVIGDGKYQLQPIYISDLVEAMLKSMTVKDAENKIIVIAGNERLEYLEILNILKQVLNKKRMNFFIPLSIMKWVAAILEKFIKPAPITRDQLIMMEMGNTGDNSKMKELFSIDPIKFENGLNKYLR